MIRIAWLFITIQRSPQFGAAKLRASFVAV